MKSAYLTALITGLASTVSTPAATINWGNTGTDFNDGASWSGGTAPGANDIATFTTATTVTQPTLTADISIQGLSITAPVGKYTGIGGAFNLTLGAGGFNYTDTTASGAGALTFVPNIIIGAAQTWNFAPGSSGQGTSTFNGAISGSSAWTFNNGAGGNPGERIILAGTNTYSGNFTIGSMGLGLPGRASETVTLLKSAGNATSDTWNDSATITITEGRSFGLVGASNTASSETIGAVTIQGAGIITTRRQGTGTSILTINSLSLGGTNDRGVLGIYGTAGVLGTANEKVLISSGAPTPSNGVLDGRYYVYDGAANSSFVANNFKLATYDSTNGFQAVTGTANTFGAGVISEINTNQTIAAATTTETIRVTGATAITLNADLTVNNNSLMLQGTTGTAIAAGTGGTLILNNGTGPAYIFTQATATTISANVNASNGLVKSGSNSLTLTGASSTIGNIWVDQGTLNFGAVTTDLSNSVVRLATGATASISTGGAKTLRGLEGGTRSTFTPGTGTFTLASQTGDDFNFGGTLAIGNKSFVQSGSGIQRISGALTIGTNATYLINVTGGSLILDGTITNTGAAGLLTVSNGATFGRAALNTLDLGTRSITFNSGSIITLGLDASLGHSTLNRGTGTWTFDPNQAFLFTGTGVVGTYTGIVSGLASDPNVTGWTIQNSGWTGYFQYNAGAVDLILSAVAIPEPSTYALIGGVLTLSIATLRRRPHTRL